MARKDYDEENVVWDVPEEEYQPVVGSDELEAEEETDDAPEEVEVAPASDPVVETPKEAPKGVVYRRLPNGALTTD